MGPWMQEQALPVDALPNGTDIEPPYYLINRWSTMISRFLAAVAATVLAVSAWPAQAQVYLGSTRVSLGIAGGANVPVSILADIADVGYNVAVSLNVGTPQLPFGFRIEGAYNGLPIRDLSGTVRILSGTANGIYNIAKTKDSPYLIAGVGAYTRRLKFDATGSGSNKTVFGINGGGGLRFPLTGVTTFVEARYHLMFGDKIDNSNFQFIPITFGVLF